jgi:hypothetical protein
MPSDISIGAAGRLLRNLAESSPTDAGQLDAWYDRADEFQLLLKEHSALSELIPHFVWHYLADADIRARDPDYRALQQAQILEIISELEGVPTDPAAT